LTERLDRLGARVEDRLDERLDVVALDLPARLPEDVRAVLLPLRAVDVRAVLRPLRAVEVLEPLVDRRAEVREPVARERPDVRELERALASLDRPDTVLPANLA